MTKRSEAGASAIEYMMLLALVAVIGIVGLRAVGPAAAQMFDTGRLGLTPPTVPAEVLGVSLERPEFGVTYSFAGPGCLAGAPTCPAPVLPF